MYNLIENQINSLKIIICQLYQNNNDLNKQLEELKIEKNKIENKIDKVKSIIPKIKCKYPPYVLSQIFGISSTKVVRLAEELKLLEDEDSCIRIPRVNKKDPKKYETIVLFSDFGFLQLFEGIFMAIKNSNYNKKINKLLEKDYKKIMPLFLSYEKIDSSDFALLGESSLKELWDTPEEDEAWKHL